MQKTIIDAMTSSKNEEFETPKVLFDTLNSIYHFELDLAANEKNKKCSRFLEDIFNPYLFDDLVLDKGDSIYMNPPYGKNIKKFIARAIEIADRYSATLVMLLPARTDTKWFNLIWDRTLKRPRPFFTFDPLEGRLTFELNGNPILNQKTGKPSAALFPSMIVEYKTYQY